MINIPLWLFIVETLLSAIVITFIVLYLIAFVKEIVMKGGKKQ